MLSKKNLCIGHIFVGFVDLSSMLMIFNNLKRQPITEIAQFKQIVKSLYKKYQKL